MRACHSKLMEKAMNATCTAYSLLQASSDVMQCLVCWQVQSGITKRC